jgi:hypothetical protein
MKTTIDLPEGILHRAKIAAAQRKTTLKDLVISGLETALQSGPGTSHRDAAFARLKKGLHLKGKTLTREQVHER